jgi:hypothetical protein
MIRQQAAIDLTHKPEDGTYITEQQIDDYLIANHKDDEDDSSIIAAQQKYQITLGMVRASNSRHGLYRDATRLPPNPAPVSTIPEGHDWDFYYRSLLAAPETKSALLTTMSSSKKPVLKSERAHKGQLPFPNASAKATCNASRHTEATQRQCNRQHRNPGDDHAGERSKPNACRAQPPLMRHQAQKSNTATERSRPSSDWSTLATMRSRSSPTTAPLA